MESLVFWGGQGWDDGTIGLYIAISCLAGLLSFFSTRSRTGRSPIFPFALASITIILFKGLCVSGVDVRIGGGYYLNFMSAINLSSFRDKSVEIGFQVFTVAIRQLTNNYGLYLLISAAVSVLPVMFVFWNLRDRVNLPFAVLGYSLVFLVTGVSAMRQFIAVGICLLVSYYYLLKHYKWAFLCLLISCSFHYSAACILLMLALLVTEKRRGIQLIVAVSSVIFCFVANNVISTLFVGRYSIYFVDESASFGLAVFFKYIPLFILLLAVESRLIVRRRDGGLEIGVDGSYLSHCWAILLFACSIALIGYIILIFGRAESYSLPIVLVLSYLIKKCEEERYFRLPVKLLVFCYFCFRLLLYMSDSYLSEGLMPYLSWL